MARYQALARAAGPAALLTTAGVTRGPSGGSSATSWSASSPCSCQPGRQHGGAA
jgi:hypothetical protein